MAMKFLLFAAALAGSTTGAAAVRIAVDTQKGRLPISPYIYGKQVASRQKVGDGVTRSAEIQMIRDSGLRITRETWGNNGTKYNWKIRMTSAPNWYNNVYPDDWDSAAKWVQDNFEQLDGLFSLPVLGWVAKTDKYNYDQPKLDPEARHREENLCGGGDTSLYLERMEPGQAVDLLDHWFGPKGMGLSPDRFPIWQMDNEPECWVHTHDDVVKEWMEPSKVVGMYARMAREVKTRYPGVKLMAPGFMEEWHWWNWNNQFVEGLPWAEYFIKGMAEESRKFGRPLIDIVNFHTYVSQRGGPPTHAEILQEHRMLYDPDYEFPRANGVRKYPEGWDENRKTEMIFARAEGWLTKHFGPDHGIGLADTECGYQRMDPMVYALWYASRLGTYADHGVRLFTVWYWEEPLWEVLHLFARYAGETRVESVSSDDETVSAYSSLKPDGGMTVILLNRDPSRKMKAEVSVKGFNVREGRHRTLTLAKLPARRTFVNHGKNALRKGGITAKDGSFGAVLPPYSITAVLLEGK